MAWHFLYGRQDVNERINWQSSAGTDPSRGLVDGEGVMIAILLRPPLLPRFPAIEKAKRLLANGKVAWVVPGDEEWLFDLDALKEKHFPGVDWVRGRVARRPEYEEGDFWQHIPWGSSQVHVGVVFYFTPELVSCRLEGPQSRRLKHEERWELIKPLGKGGQGRVSLVRDKWKYEGREMIRRTILDSIAEMTRQAAEGRRESGAESLIAAISAIVKADEPNQLGALKELHSPEEARDSKGAKERMGREMEAMSKVVHPSLLKLLDFNTDELWFVSEYHSNGKLTDRQSSFAGNVATAMKAIRPLVEGVSKIHQSKMVHRDIKPDNVFLSSEGRLVLVFRTPLPYSKKLTGPSLLLSGMGI